MRAHLVCLWLGVMGCVEPPVLVDGSGGAAGATTSETTGAQGTTGAAETASSSASAMTCPTGRLPADVSCGGLMSDFESLSGWEEINETRPTDIDIEDGSRGKVLRVNLDNSVPFTFAQSATDIELTECSVFFRLLEAAPDSDIRSGVSLGPDGASALLSLDVLDGRLFAREASGVEIASVAYDADDMHWLRVRESEGATHYGYSDDGVCWTEFVQVPTAVNESVRVRLVVQHNPSGPGNTGAATFDDLGRTP